MTPRSQSRLLIMVFTASLLLGVLLPAGAPANAHIHGPATALRATSSEQRRGSYDLIWWSVDSGGCTVCTAGGYTLGGTIGQPDAGLMTGGAYTLGGGFWGVGAVAEGFQVYLPLTLRRH